jgi:hypothetical protein
MAEERVRVEVGFVGGTIVAAQMSVADAERLHHKLAAGGNGTVDVELEDGTCTVVVAHVLYLKRYARESRVGFGG